MSKKNYTEQQKAFLAALATSGGNVRVAMDQAGYSKNTPTSDVVKPLKEEMIDQARSLLAVNAYYAAASLIGIVDDPNQPGTNQKLNAVKEILDRVGLIKEEKISVDVSDGGLFILPAKTVTRPTEEDN